MPVNRRPTPPPEAIKQTNTVMDSLNAWTDTQSEDAPVSYAEDPEQRKKGLGVPLGYLRMGEPDKGPGTATGWRAFFDGESDRFNFAIGLVIILNAIVIGLETDMGREHFLVAEHVFNTIFVCEMFARIFQLGPEYFTTFKYLFDCSLVVAGSLDLWILPAISAHSKEKVSDGGVGYEFSVMRLLRILRLMRVLRVIRLFRMFGQLLLIITAFGKAFQVVMLLSVLVVIMLYAGSIVCTQLIGHQSYKWGENAEDVEYWFGSIPTSMTTLFSVMFGSSWDPLLKLLTQVYMPGFVLLLFAAFMVVTVSLAALIIGLISESLIIAQQEFKQRKLATFSTKKKEIAADYKEELNALVEDDMDEFQMVEGRVLKENVKGDAIITQKLMDAGIAIRTDGLGGIVDSISKNGAERVSVDHFVEKLINLSGNSSASQVVDVKYDLVKNQNQMAAVEQRVDELMATQQAQQKKIEDILKKVSSL